MKKPKLEYRAEFERLLENYHVSEEGLEILAKTNLALLRAPSGGGRNTIIKELVKTDLYEFVVSDTTRPKRVNDGVMEQDGVEYWFRSEEDVLSDIVNGLYLEAEVIHNQQVSGISIRELKKALDHNKISINEVHFEGVENVIKLKQDTHVIFITPPSYETWIDRFSNRGEIAIDEFSERFSTAKQDYEHALKNPYYKFVINDNLEDAVTRVRQIVETNDYPDELNREAQELCEKILTRLSMELFKVPQEEMADLDSSLETAG